MSIEPHSWLTSIRPDEVAECWEGVDGELYAVLWKAMDAVPPIPNIEDSGPMDHVGYGSVASVWGQFDDKTKAQLNELARKEQAEWD